MTYSTINSPCNATLEIKKSQFLAFAYPVASREQALFHMEQLRQQFPDARHHCWAYIIGDPHNTTDAGFDDDGEPTGTAGKPILNLLQHKSIGNCVVVVVRYFGGIKLGAGGLARAYGAAAQATLADAALTPFEPLAQLSINCAFADEAFIRHIVAGFGGEVLAVTYQQQVQLSIKLAARAVADLRAKLQDSLGKTVSLTSSPP